MRKELWIGLIIGGAALAVFSGASVGSLLFAAVILACPLMMVFMGHGDHGAHTDKVDGPEEAPSGRPASHQH